MKVEVEVVSGWKNALSAARFTVGKDTPKDKEPSYDWKMDMCRAGHSPIREVVFRIKCTDMPWRVLWHLVRHHVGIEKYVRTSRPDRRPQATTDLYDVIFTINAQALIQISDLRLCNTAYGETRMCWRQILAAVNDVDPAVVSWCAPRCVKLGACPEMKCCGFIYGQNYQDWRERYLSNFKDVYTKCTMSES